VANAQEKTVEPLMIVMMMMIIKDQGRDKL
jgi:hypothetical protein